MTECIGFKAVSRRDARVLILGTLPGVKSLEARQYYAMKQNSFWKIMGELIGAFPDRPYQYRLDSLIKNKIALWDVCQAAKRKGSLDADIKAPKANDFASFFKVHKNIEAICFNGQPAHKMFLRYVWPKITKKDFVLCVLPSTSSANARLRYDQKLSQWRAELGRFVVFEKAEKHAP